jgi:hypothetical protein
MRKLEVAANEQHHEGLAGQQDWREQQRNDDLSRCCDDDHADGGEEQLANLVNGLSVARQN